MIPPAPPAVDQPEIYCPSCGYDLRGIDASQHCPECGFTIDREAFAESRIPWVHRARLGRIRAYARTLPLGSWRIASLAAEIARPADLRHARRFANITALLVSLPVAAGVTWAMWRHGRNVVNPLPHENWLQLSNVLSPEVDALLPFAAGATLWGVLPVGVLVTAWLITRTPSKMFALDAALPPERRRRAEALSYYTSAPLIFLPWAALLYVLALDLRRAGEQWAEVAMALSLLGVIVGGLSILLTWTNPLLLLRRTAQASGLRLIAAGVALMISWGFCAVVGLLVVPWVVGFVWLLIDSVLA